MKRFVAGASAAGRLLVLAAFTVAFLCSCPKVSLWETVKKQATPDTQYDWKQQTSPTINDSSVAVAGANFGTSVSIYGDYAVVGAPYENSSQGSAYLYHRSGTTWQLVTPKITAPDAVNFSYFGYSVSVSGTLIAVGAFGHTVSGHASAGEAYLFQISGSTWSWVRTYTASTPANNEQFGYAVAVSDPAGWLVVGSPQDSTSVSNGGAVYFYNRQKPADPWGPVNKLYSNNEAAGDWFGSAVAVDTYAVVGAVNHAAFTGSAYVFAQSAGTWGQTKDITPIGLPASQFFGCSVSTLGDLVIVGGRGGGPAGMASVFAYNGGKWTETGLPSGVSAAANFGGGVGITQVITVDKEIEYYAVVGAPGYDSGTETQAGTAFIYETGSSGWALKKQILASDGKATDYFGFSTAISGDYAVVGAPQWDVNHPANASSDEGAGYVFYRGPLP